MFTTFFILHESFTLSFHRNMNEKKYDDLQLQKEHASPCMTQPRQGKLLPDLQGGACVNSEPKSATVYQFIFEKLIKINAEGFHLQNTMHYAMEKQQVP